MKGQFSGSVRNLVQTQFNERFFEPDLGSSVGDLVFEFVDFGASSEIKDQIKQVVEEFEPRVDNVMVEVSPRSRFE